MGKQNNNKKGVTLLEIITVVTLSVIIIAATYSIYLISYRSYQQNSTDIELTQNARIALERMSRDIRQALEVLTVLPADPDSGTPASELKFQDGHNMISGGQIQYVRYYLSDTDLHRQFSHYSFTANPGTWVPWSAVDALGQPPTETIDSDQIKAQNISSLQFWGNNTITINLSVSIANKTYYFQTKSLARNVQ